MCSLTARQSWRLSYFYAEIFSDNRDQLSMKNHSLISSVYAALVLSACFIQGYSLPSKSLQRWENTKTWGWISDVQSL